MFNVLNKALRVNRQHQSQRQQGSEEGLSTVMSLATGTAQVAELRTETWQGREYTVVPVVAIVEGVLHGANASGPEFASADEFGKFPKAWDGRPVVMNHPQLNGVFVSAGMPEVLEDYGMGMIFNSRVEDRKLKVEAWLDHGRIEEIGGELLTTLERIRGGQMVEVSVGAWLDVAHRSGTFNGKNYVGVWQNVAPDHLAFLSEGVPGACSVKDGCGVPRLFSKAGYAVVGAKAVCCESCSQGKPCEGSGSPAVETVETLEPEDLSVAEQLDQHKKALALQEQFHDFLEASVEFDPALGLSVNAIPDSMALSDVRLLAYQGLLELLNLPAYDVDLMAITASSVVYYVWGKPGLHMRSMSIGPDGDVTFSGDEVPVNLLTRIVPRQTTEPSVNITQAQETEMTGTTTGENGGQAAAGEGTGAGIAPAGEGTAAAVPTFEQLLAAAPSAMRESFESGVRMFEARKAELVKDLVACERNNFTEDQLKAFSIDQLENMAKLANVASYAGRAVAGGQEGISTNAGAGAGGEQRSAVSVSKANTDYLSAKAE